MLLKTKSFEFEEFRLNTEERVLLRQSEIVSLTPKAFQLLLVLVKNQGRTVQKSELMKEVWADSFVEEGNLTFTINLLRKTLGDDRQNPRFIETIPKHGYRFIAEVKTIEEYPAINRNESQTDVFLPKPTFPGNEPARRNYLFAVVSLLVLFIVTIGLGAYLSKQQKTKASEKRSILVLPLKPINQGNRDELYEFGIADSLIQRLSVMKGLMVRPLSMTRKYADIDQDPLAAGKEQQVNYVLVSNYQTANGKIRVTTQLLNVENGQIEETYKSEKDTGDVFATQDAVSEDLSKLFQRYFAVPAGSPAAQRGTENEEAYRLYLQAMFLLDKENLADQKRAIELLDKSLVLDPNYAKAWAGKAQAHCAYAHYGGDSPDAQFAEAKPAIDRALQLNSNLPEAYAVLGIISTDYDWDIAKGEKYFLSAIQSAPGSDIFHLWYANRLSSQGRSDEAIAMVKTAIDLNPNYIGHQIYYGRILYFARRYDEAITQLERAAEIDPTNPSIYRMLWQCFHMKGDYSRAYESFMKFRQLIGTKDDVIKTYETLYAQSGWQSVLLKYLEIAKPNNTNGYAAYSLAALSAFTGNREQSLNYLNFALNSRSLEIYCLKGDPSFDSLRGDPRFEELLGQIKSKNTE